MSVEQQSDAPIIYISPNTTVLEFLNAIKYHKIILEEWLSNVLRTTFLPYNTKMLETMQSMRPNKDVATDIQSGVQGAMIRIVNQAPVIYGIPRSNDTNRIPTTRFSGNSKHSRKRPSYHKGV